MKQLLDALVCASLGVIVGTLVRKLVRNRRRYGLTNNPWVLLKRWAFRTVNRLHYWFGESDICEVCHDVKVETTCESCERRMCYECTSNYYNDVDICSVCRAQITPEEEEADRKETAQATAEDNA